MKISHSTANECAAQYHTVDFPKHVLLSSKHVDADVDLAACLATPSDVPETHEPVFRATVGWLEYCNKNQERFNRLSQSLRRMKAEADKVPK